MTILLEMTIPFQDVVGDYHNVVDVWSSVLVKHMSEIVTACGITPDTELQLNNLGPASSMAIESGLQISFTYLTEDDTSIKVIISK